MGALLNYLSTKEEKLRADAVLCERYAQTGAQFFEILPKGTRRIEPVNRIPEADIVVSVCAYRGSL